MEIEADFVGCDKKTGSLFPVCFALTFIKLYMNQPFVSDTGCFVKIQFRIYEYQ